MSKKTKASQKKNNRRPDASNKLRSAGGQIHIDSIKDAGKTKEKPLLHGLADYLAVLPGILMCAMLFIMLVLDVMMPGMEERQFVVFPNLFTVLDYLIIAAGLVHLGISAKKKELRFEKTDACFAAFAVLILLSTFVNGFNFMTIDGVPYRYIGILNMFAFMLIYMGVSRSIRSEELTGYILTGYLAAADLIGLAALLDTFTGGIAAFHDKKELSAVFFNGNHYGYFLMMAVLIGLAYYLFGSGRTAVFGAVSAALNLVLLAINHSLGSILALLIVLAVTWVLIALRDRTHLKKMRLLACVLFAAFIVAILISPALRKEFTGFAADLGAILAGTADGSAGHRRLQMWTLTTGYISEKPLLGYGCEGIAFMLYEAMKVSDPHCELLAYAAYYGIPAAILYAAGVAGTIISSMRRMSAAPGKQGGTKNVCRKAACMAAAGYFISSFTGVGMFYTLPFFFIFLGISSRR